MWLMVACLSNHPDAPGYYFTSDPWSPTDQDSVVDTIVQTTPSSVDILIGIDPALGPDFVEALPWLVDPLTASASEWRVGLVSTALGIPEKAGILAVPLIEGDSDPIALETLADLGPYGGLGATFLALQPGANDSFPSAEAVHIVILSSTDDTTPAEVVTPDDWIEFVVTNWPGTTLSVIAPLEAAILASVTDVPLADVSLPLGPSLADIALRASGLQQEFFLTERPMGGAVVVDVNFNDAVLSFGPEEWTYVAERNSVQFLRYVPPPTSQVHLTYRPAE